MPSRSNIWLLVLAFLFLGAGASIAEDLTITGTKDFQYRSFSITGSLNQFLVDHPTFLADRGFRQSLRLNVSGKLTDNVRVDVAVDDTNDIEKEQKLLVHVDGDGFDVTAGRLTLDFPGTHYLLFNKKALAAIVNWHAGAHTISVLAGRPEGDAGRDFFTGKGAEAEYLLKNKPVVRGSEIVNLDGRVLQRGSDYEMDYEGGTLILSKRLLPVEATSRITVEYETQTAGSAFRNTVVGVRESVKLPAWKAWHREPPPPEPVTVAPRVTVRRHVLAVVRAEARAVREKALAAVAAVKSGKLGPAEPAILANFGLPGEPLPGTVLAASENVSKSSEMSKDPLLATTHDPPPIPGALAPPRSAVPPSPLLAGDRARTQDATLGALAYMTQPNSPGPGSYPGSGSAVFPNAGAVPLPSAFGAAPDPYGDRRPAPPVAAVDDHAGVSFVLSSDSEVSGGSDPLVSTANTTPTTAAPRRLGVLGADVAYRLGDSWRVTGEVAESILDPDRRISDPLKHATAWDVALLHTGPRWDFRLARQHLGTGFEAVGKKEFVRLGEVGDLSSDLDLTSAFSRFDILRNLFLDSAVEVSETNLGRDAKLPAKDFTGFGNGLSWVFEPQGRVLVRHREDVSDASQPGVAAAHVSHRVRAGAVTKPLGSMVLQLRGEEIEDRGIDPTLVGNTTTYGASLGDATHRRYKWNVNGQDARFVSPLDKPLRDALSVGGLVDLSFSRFLNGTATLLDRNERDLVTNIDQQTRTGELKLRYQPFDTLNLNSKVNAEERSRILKQTADPLLALVPLAPGQNTLVAEKPVVAMNQSHTADWQPSKRWEHRASYRKREETEVASGALISRDHAVGYRLRWAPGTIFRTTTEVETGRSLSRQANFDRDTWLCTEELLWSLPKGLNLGLTYNDIDAKDRRTAARDRTTTGAGHAERTLGRYFTGLAKLSHTNKVQGGRSGENALGLGLRYALPHDPIRLQLDGEVAGVTGVDPKGTPFDSSRHKAGVRVDGQPVKSLNVECAITWVQAGANALGENGYNGWTIESKAFFDF